MLKGSKLHASQPRHPREHGSGLPRHRKQQNPRRQPWQHMTLSQHQSHHRHQHQRHLLATGATRQPQRQSSCRV